MLTLYYLSGPMTGYAESNYPAFERAAALLRARGLVVVSPHELPHDDRGGPGSLPWTVYLRNDLKELIACHAIVLLPGWPKSHGARLELDVAVRLGYQVFYLDADDRLVDMNGAAPAGGK